jgi:hypothetical protein
MIEVTLQKSLVALKRILCSAPMKSPITTDCYLVGIFCPGDTLQDKERGQYIAKEFCPQETFLLAVGPKLSA